MNTCPHCKAELDGRSEIGGDDAVPEEGDFSFCFECGHWSAFDADLTMRPLTAEEEADVKNNPIFSVVRSEWDKLFRKYQ